MTPKITLEQFVSDLTKALGNADKNCSYLEYSEVIKAQNEIYDTLKSLTKAYLVESKKMYGGEQNLLKEVSRRIGKKERTTASDLITEWETNK